jgi:hypothetical protein
MSERRSRFVFGWVAVLAGVGMAAIVYWRPEGAEAPLWVVYAACGAFVFAGLSLITDESAHPQLNAWLAVGCIAAMVVPGAWIALGAGPRKCSVSVPLWNGHGSDALCRGVFGFGALLVALFLVWAVVRTIKQQRAS